MIELNRIQYMVYEILRDNEDCRNSDNWLYLEVLKKHGINVLGMSVDNFFRHFSDYDVPRYETVSRARRKVQELIPELESVESVRKWRHENETRFREFSKEKRIQRRDDLSIR